ncbi:MAG: sugar ABC transporter, partial [Hespellia sp.]|nr:sugar ABC transporter [Hespellia sp.]
MKKRVVAMICCAAMVAASVMGCGGKETTGSTGGSTEATSKEAVGDGYKIALITMDSIDQHWIT